MKVALIGFMGSGKSTAARELSRLLAVPAVELDDAIVTSSGRGSVSEIFEKDGEARFRELERAACAAMASRTGVIVSCGGGIIESPENISALKAGGGALVYLRTRFDSIEGRLVGDQSRPLFRERERAKQLYDSRSRRYEEAATLIVDTDGKTPREVAEGIVEGLDA